jgi:ATP-dependent DNA helicase RecG
LDGFVLADLDLEDRREGDVLGRNQSGRAITLRLLSLAKHRQVIESAREICERVYAGDPSHVGMALLAAQFTGTERIEYLDKS